MTILIVFNAFAYNTIVNAAWVSSVYWNYNLDDTLKISWNFDTKIDTILLKKYSWNYYNQFLFIKSLNTKINELAKIYPNQKSLFDELKNYLSLKWDFIYKLNTISVYDREPAISSFKKSITEKWATLNKVIEWVNSLNTITITNKNNNFDTLTNSDFVEFWYVALFNETDNTNINKYEISDNILSNARTITAWDFKKIQNILTSNIKITDEFNNTIYWEINSKWGSYYSNTELTKIINQKLEDFWNLKKEKMNSDTILWMWELYNVFDSDDLLYSFLSQIKPIWKITSDNTVIKIEEVKKWEYLKWYLITFDAWSKDLISYWDIKTSKVWLYILYDDNYWDFKYYLAPALNKIIYLWDNKNKEKQYMVINFFKKKISFIKNVKSSWDWSDTSQDTKSNINIVFEDGDKINWSLEYSLDDFKELINKKITRINIDWNEITNSDLLNKWSIINTLK